MNSGGNFFEKKSLRAVATALTGISRLVTLISLSENKINSVKIKIIKINTNLM